MLPQIKIYTCQSWFIIVSLEKITALQEEHLVTTLVQTQKLMGYFNSRQVQYKKLTYKVVLWHQLVAPKNRRFKKITKKKPNWISNGNGTLTRKNCQLCVIKMTDDMTILWVPGVSHTDYRWKSACYNNILLTKKIISHSCLYLQKSCSSPTGVETNENVISLLMKSYLVWFSLLAISFLHQIWLKPMTWGK